MQEGQYMLGIMDEATMSTNEYISNNKSKALERFNQCTAIRDQNSVTQVKRFHTDGGSEYISKKFTEYLKQIAY